jgi:hypothetical protein
MKTWFLLTGALFRTVCLAEGDPATFLLRRARSWVNRR